MFENEFSPSPRPSSGWDALAPNVKADLILLLPFILADFFNYYSAGAALIISGPIMFIIYLVCVTLCGYFALNQGRTGTQILALGAFAGAGLWMASTILNTIIGLFLGTASLGATLIMGIPYLCLCAPFNLIGGALIGAFGAWFYSLFSRPHF